MSEEPVQRQRGEKDEKQKEKDEKGRHEKNFEEKWRRDPLSAAVWALILIWGGLVLLASQLPAFASLEPKDGNWWGYFFLGAGAILLLEAIFRTLVAAYRGPIVGTLILGLVFLGIGLGSLGIEETGAYIGAGVLIVIGAIILIRGLSRPRQQP